MITILVHARGVVTVPTAHLTPAGVGLRRRHKVQWWAPARGGERTMRQGLVVVQRMSAAVLQRKRHPPGRFTTTAGGKPAFLAIEVRAF